MTAAEDAEDYLRRYHPEQAELALWVRSILIDAEPDLEQRVYRGGRRLVFMMPRLAMCAHCSPVPSGFC